MRISGDGESRGRARAGGGGEARTGGGGWCCAHIWVREAEVCFNAVGFVVPCIIQAVRQLTRQKKKKKKREKEKGKRKKEKKDAVAFPDPSLRVNIYVRNWQFHAGLLNFLNSTTHSAIP